MKELDVAAIAAMLLRASTRVGSVFTSDDPVRALRAAQQACRRAEARIENLRRLLEHRP